SSTRARGRGAVRSRTISGPSSASSTTRRARSPPPSPPRPTGSIRSPSAIATASSCNTATGACNAQAPFSAACEADGAGDCLGVVRWVAVGQACRDDLLVQAVERMLVAIADGAEDLMRLARDGEAGVAGIALRHGGFRIAGKAFLRLPCRMQDEGTRALDTAR